MSIKRDMIPMIFGIKRMDSVQSGPVAPPKDYLAIKFDPDAERIEVIIDKWDDFEKGDIICKKTPSGDLDRIAIMVGWFDNESVWRYESWSDDVGAEIGKIPLEMADLILPAIVLRETPELHLFNRVTLIKVQPDSDVPLFRSGRVIHLYGDDKYAVEFVEPNGRILGIITAGSDSFQKQT